MARLDRRLTRKPTIPLAESDLPIFHLRLDDPTSYTSYTLRLSARDFVVSSNENLTARDCRMRSVNSV